MSISGALSSAMQGLRAAGRGSEVIAANLSNALTPGYGVRTLELSSNTTGIHGGVRIDGIRRIVNEAVISDKRLAEAAQANSSAINDVYIAIEQMIGTPDNPASISAQIAELEKNLITAASRPDASERLGAAVASAKTLTNTFVAAADRLQTMRTSADSKISAQVDQLNTALDQVQKLNTQITKFQSGGNNTAALLDQRQKIIDEISILVPVRSVARDHGQVALFSMGGAVLLDHTAAEIGFSRTNIVTPHQTIDAGNLHGLTINGLDIRVGSDSGLLAGGAIAAQFQIRDEIAVNAQNQIDALARDMIERFQDPAVDPTLTGTAAGLFTDDGSAFMPANEVGLAQRIMVNALVDPSQGGQTWQLRDGMGATVPGDAGDGTLLNGLANALSSARIPQSGLFTSAAFSANDLASALASDFGMNRSASEQKLSFSAAQVDELTERLLSEGVDSDQELQRLLLVEQSYAANARMIQVVDEMMQTLLRI